MRSWSSQLQTYGAQLCASIPEPADISPLLARIIALEKKVAALQTVAPVQNTVVESLISWEVVYSGNSPFAIQSGGVGLECDTRSSAIAITLPPASAWKGESILIKDFYGNAAINNIVVTPQPTETIDGDATLTIDGDYVNVMLQSDGTNIVIV